MSHQCRKHVKQYQNSLKKITHTYPIIDSVHGNIQEISDLIEMQSLIERNFIGPITTFHAKKVNVVIGLK